MSSGVTDARRDSRQRTQSHQAQLPPQPPGHRFSWRWAALPLAVVMLVAGVIWLKSRPGDAGSAQADVSPSTASHDKVGVRSDRQPSQTGHTDAPPPGQASVATPARSQLTAQQPRAVSLPSGATVRIDVTATGTNGELAIPSDVNRAGWWDGSSRLGEPYGATVLAAHIDSFSQGLGRFAELLDARQGDHIRLDSADLRQQFRVVSATLIPKASLSAQSDLFASTGPSRVVLITCGGAYDESEGGYQDNMIVIAEPVGPVKRS